MVDEAPSFHSSSTYASMNHRRRAPQIFQGVAISAWKPDQDSRRCGVCTKRFTIIRRKHHCRACGDICCRRCLVLCLVDVPLAGVDMAYTCAKCVRRHSRKTSLLDDFVSLCSQHLESPTSASAYSLSALSSPGNTDTMMQRSKSSNLDSFVSFGSIPLASPGGVTPSQDGLAGSSGGLNFMGLLVSSQTATPSSSSLLCYQVVVSQYHNQKLFSVCALLSDYLECTGGAMLLMEDSHVWVLAHKGLPSSALHSASFLSMCQKAMNLKRGLTISHHPTSQNSGSQGPRGPTRKKSTRNSPPTFQFFGAAPLSLKKMPSAIIGCLAVLDTQSRDENESKKIQKTLEKLAHVVMNLLIEEKNILRLYSSGDFKIFTSNEQFLTDSLPPGRHRQQQQQQHVSLSLIQPTRYEQLYDTRSTSNSPSIASGLRPVTMLNPTTDATILFKGDNSVMARSKSYTAGEIAQSLS